MLVEVKRFHRRARQLVQRRRRPRHLAGFLAGGRFSPYFTSHFMVPLVSCVWSAAPGVALCSPARYLFAFLDNHGMLSVTGSPAWRTVIGGSRTYVERAAKELTRGGHRRRRCGPCIRHGRRRRGPRRRRSDAPSSTGRRGDPRRHRASPAGRAHRRRSGRRSAPSPTPATRPGCTPTPACSRRTPGPGVVELPAAVCARRSGPGPGVLRHEPAAGAAHATPHIVTLNATDRIDPTSGPGPDDLRAPDLHARLGGRPTPAARASTTASSPSPAPTTAGASTRTAAVPASAAAAALGRDVVMPQVPALYRGHVTHVRRRRCTTGSATRSAIWLVDIDQLPATALGWLRFLTRVDGARPRGRPGSAAPSTASPPTGPHAHDRPGARLRLQPDRVYWCYDGAGNRTAVRRRGAQHLRRPARLRPRHRRRRGAPGHRQGHVRLAVLPGRRAVPHPRQRTRRLGVGDGDAAARGRPTLRRHTPGRAPTGDVRQCRCARRCDTRLLGPVCSSAGRASDFGARVCRCRRDDPVIPRPHHPEDRDVSRDRASRGPACRRLGAVDLDRWPALAPPKPAPVRAAWPAPCSAGWRPLPASASACPTARASGRACRSRACRCSTRRRSSPGSAGTARSASARPTWPATGTLPTSSACSRPLARHIDTLVPPPLQWLRRFYDARQPASEDNDRGGARRNIARHYDLSNELFATFLDETMTYSSALFADPGDIAGRGPGAARSSGCSTPPAWVAGSRRPRDRHRLGRAGPAGRPAGRRGHHRDAVGGAGRAGPPRVAAAGLAGSVDVRVQDYRDVDRAVRRHRQRRDDRGGRRAMVADLLPHPRRPAGARRPGRAAGDPHAPRPAAGQPARRGPGSTSTSSPAG